MPKYTYTKFNCIQNLLGGKKRVGGLICLLSVSQWVNGDESDIDL